MSAVAAGLVALLASATWPHVPADPVPDSCLVDQCGPLPYEMGSWLPDTAATKTFGTSAARARGQVATAAALGMLGTPYSWGGGSAAGPTRGTAHGKEIVGFDCSGLTLYAWAKAGVQLGHYTGTQFRQGLRVRKRDLQPGDLVFFGDRGGVPNHVGLNLGGGVMVHAPQTGDVVKKTDFQTSEYYSSRYRGAVRPGVKPQPFLPSPPGGWMPGTGPGPVTIDPGGA